MRRIYLDHAATTPLDPRVFEAMTPLLKEDFGNASSVHTLGRKARFYVEESRAQIAAFLGAEPGEIIFTSGGTESNNTALKGARVGDRQRLVTSAVEHEAVLRPAHALQNMGWPVTTLAPGPHGAVSPAQAAAALSGDTRLVSLMHANNETGAITEVVEIADLCHEQGALFHCDAVQTAGLFRLQVNSLGVDLLSASAHKFYGPKGIGFLYVRQDVELEPLVEGGAQERRRRGGTENVAAIVGMATAMRLATEEAEARVAHITSLRNRLYLQLRKTLGDTFILNTPLENADTAPHILNIAFTPQGDQSLDGEMLLLNLDMEGILVSSGSACTSGALEPSHVLLAMGRDRQTASAALRFSLGKDNTEEEIDIVTESLRRILARMNRAVVQGAAA